MNNFKGGNPTLNETILDQNLNELNLDQNINNIPIIITFEDKIRIIHKSAIQYKYVNKSLLLEFEYYKYNSKNKYQLFNKILINLVKFYIDENARTNAIFKKNMTNIVDSIKTSNDVIILLKQILCEIIKYGDINSIPEEKKYEDYFNYNPDEDISIHQKCFTKEFIDEKISDNEIEALFELYIISNLLTS